MFETLKAVYQGKSFLSHLLTSLGVELTPHFYKHTRGVTEGFLKFMANNLYTQ